MLRNHLKVALRHLSRNKVFSFVNVLGLAVSISSFALIMQYISFELSYDRFHSNSDQIHRIALEFYENGELKNTSAKTYDEVRHLLIEHMPQLEHITSFVKIPANTGFLFRHDQKLFNELGGFIEADSNFFKVFPSLLVRGNPETALSHPNSLVIAESIATKIFGDQDPIGKFIGNVNEVKQGGDYLVTGVLRDLPENSHFHAKFIGVYDMKEWGNYQHWNWFFYTYVTIPAAVDRAIVRDRIARVNEKLQSMRTETRGARVIVQPITGIHLRSDLVDELEPNGNLTLVYVLTGIGLLILLIAWTNYINLETARFIVRAKSVGIRRVIGSGKGALAIQFLMEHGLITLMAIGVACLVLYFVAPHLPFLAGVPLPVLAFSTPAVWLASLGLLLIGSVLVGLYPSSFLMRFNPVSVLKGQTAGVGRGRRVRKILVVFQFTVSICLIAFLFIINGQLDHILVANRKIDLDQVVAIRNPTAYMNQESDGKLQDFRNFESQLLQHSSIRDVATSSAVPGTEIGFTYVDLVKRNVGDPYDPTRYKTLFVDYSYIPVYGLKLLAGRNYSPENGEDENWSTLILNEKAIRNLGFQSPEEAVGQNIQFMAVEKWDTYKIVGVVEDYHHEAVKKETFPMILFLNHNFGQQVYYSIKLNAGAHAGEAVSYIEESWKKVFPDRPFEYFFIDSYYDQQFKNERHFSRIFFGFAAIALFVACLGIFGMTLFEANMRLKELSIRKVLGASVSSLIGLLARDHIRLILAATVFAVPLIYYFAEEWLNNYPTRIDLTPVAYLLPLMIVAVMVFITSGFHTIKAANTNPVDHLKHE